MAQAELQNIKSQAHFLLEAGRSSEAITLLTQGLNLAPDDEEILCLLSQASIELDRWRDAWRYVERAIAVAPENDWAHRIHSIVLRNSARRHEAVAAAKEAVRLNPMAPHNWHTLASAQLNVFALQEARANAERLRELAPSWYLSHQMLALVALKEERHKEAEACCRRELELNPNSYHGMNNLGVALLNQKRKREAIDAFTRAAKVNPRAPIARDNIRAAVGKYLPRLSFPFILLWFFVNSLTRIGEGGQSGGVLLAALLILLVVGGSFALRAYRYRRLPPEVRSYLKAAETRQHKSNWFTTRQVLFCCIVLGSLVLASWFVISLFRWNVEGLVPGLWDLVTPVVMGLFLAGVIVGYRRAGADRDEELST